MAYSENILPKSSVYYELNNAEISGTDLIINQGGYAEIDISKQMLSALTSKMLIVVHPSVFSSPYTNDAVQVQLSIITEENERINILASASKQPSGVFNTEVELPVGNYTSFTYRISSSVPVTVYNWELCAETSDDVSVIIDGVEQALPRLLYDYNTYSYAVAQRELTVGLISCYLQSATDLQGHFTLSFFATERCNVHVRIKDNNVTELFSPQVYTVEKGYASISIPHAYLKKTATDHAFAVTVQCTNGQLSIPVRGLLYTIDGGYLATRLLDAGIDIEDLSICQLKTDESPSEIWAVGFEGNRLLLKKRVYNQLQRVDWTAVKDFGEGLHAAVEFYGRWTSRTNAAKHTLETESVPFVFIIDTHNVLRVYSGSSFVEALELDTNVSAVSACQGFNSMYDITQDQGLVVSYVKNGNVYYRQWLYNSNVGTYMWYPAELLYDGNDATFVNVHRLPDYRLGFCIEHASGTKWYITDRTYVSQAVKTEVVSAAAVPNILPTVIDASEAPGTVAWPATLNEFEVDYSYNDFIITFNGDFVFFKGKTIDDLYKSLTVTVGGVKVEVETILLSGGTLSVHLKNDVSGGKTITVNLNSDWLLIRIYNNCLATIKQSHSWSLPVPTHEVTFSNEDANVKANATPNIKVTPIITTNLSVPDSASVKTSATLTAEITQVKDNLFETPNESVGVAASATASVTILQAGTTPV